MDWSLYIESKNPEVEFTEDHADTLAEALKDYAPAVSYSARTLAARFCVEADLPGQAVRAGLQILSAALKKVGLKATIVGVEIQMLEELDRTLDEPNVPDLMGVGELARSLKVSRQRASQLTKGRSFPKPLVILDAGPVWRKSTVARHVMYWTRRTGRPKTMLSSFQATIPREARGRAAAKAHKSITRRKVGPLIARKK